MSPDFSWSRRGQQWHIVGYYLEPDNALTIYRISPDISQHPCRTKLLVVGNFNTYLAGPEVSKRDKDIVAALLAAGLEDISENFIPLRQPCYRDVRTWIMVQMGREVRSRTDYTLRTDHRLIRKTFVKYPSHN